MNSFKLTAVGHLARNPELSVSGTTTFARFCLVGQDDVTDSEEDGMNREVVTSVWFIAFGDIGAEIASGARKGDQLFLEAGVIANDWIERGEKQSGHTFVVTGFRFGAKRGDPGASAAVCRCTPPETPRPLSMPAEAEA
jgi:single-stranded DNA-binding protein